MTTNGNGKPKNGKNGNGASNGNGKRGQPTKYKPEYCSQATKLARLGATDKDIADFFGVNEDTVHEWKKVHPEFSESLKEGKEYSDAHVSDRLYQRAIGYEHESVKIFNANGKPLIVPYIEYFAPDTTACIFWLKNRRPDLWKDTHTIDATKDTLDFLKELKANREA